MEKHDSDSGHSPTGDVEKVDYSVRHAEDRFPDPDAGKSLEERAAIVRMRFITRDVGPV